MYQKKVNHTNSVYPIVKKLVLFFISRNVKSHSENLRYIFKNPIVNL